MSKKNCLGNFFFLMYRVPHPPPPAFFLALAIVTLGLPPPPTPPKNPGSTPVVKSMQGNVPKME